MDVVHHIVDRNPDAGDATILEILDQGHKFPHLSHVLFRDGLGPAAPHLGADIDVAGDCRMMAGCVKPLVMPTLFMVGVGTKRYS